jgi:UDP-glucose 4-epimerase
MNIFITGGSGFIGSHLVKLLTDNGHHITLLVRSPDKIPFFKGIKRISIIHGTLQEYGLVGSSLKGIDACIHLALGWGETARDMAENDTIPSITLFTAAVDAGVKKILYASSVAAFGQLRPYMNSSSDLRPIDFYGATKAATESYLLAIASYHNIQCNIIRPSYTFGNPVFPGAPMQPDKKIFAIVSSARRNEPVRIIKNDGTQFTGIQALIRLFQEVLFSDFNRSVFLGVGSSFITWEEIADYAIRYTRSKSAIEFEDRGWEKGTFAYDNTTAWELFHLKFDTRDDIEEHIRYLADMSSPFPL